MKPPARSVVVTVDVDSEWFSTAAQFAPAGSPGETVRIRETVRGEFTGREVVGVVRSDGTLCVVARPRR